MDCDINQPVAAQIDQDVDQGVAPEVGHARPITNKDTRVSYQRGEIRDVEPEVNFWCCIVWCGKDVSELCMGLL